METTGADTSSALAESDFTFATQSPWLGLDPATMQVHSRARMIQSKQRAERLRRKNLSLRHLLEMAQAQRHMELDIRRAEPTQIRYPSTEPVIELSQADMIDLRLSTESTDRDRLVALREIQARSAAAARH